MPRFHTPAYRTGQARLPHPALGKDARPRRVTPSATSEHKLGVARLIVNPPVLRCFLRWSFKLRSLPSAGSYPASSVVRTSPPPHTARPGSRELPVDPDRDHRWGFPCCACSPCRHAVATTPAGPPEPCARYCSSDYGLPRNSVGAAPALTFFEACSAFTRVTACRLAKSPYATLYTEHRRLCCLYRRSDYCRVERSSSRAGLSPLKTIAFSRRTVKRLLSSIVRYRASVRSPAHSRQPLSSVLGYRPVTMSPDLKRAIWSSILALPCAMMATAISDSTAISDFFRNVVSPGTALAVRIVRPEPSHRGLGVFLDGLNWYGRTIRRAHRKRGVV